VPQAWRCRCRRARACRPSTSAPCARYATPLPRTASQGSAPAAPGVFWSRLRWLIARCPDLVQAGGRAAVPIRHAAARLEPARAGARLVAVPVGWLTGLARAPPEAPCTARPRRARRCVMRPTPSPTWAAFSAAGTLVSPARCAAAPGSAT